MCLVSVPDIYLNEQMPYIYRCIHASRDRLGFSAERVRLILGQRVYFWDSLQMFWDSVPVHIFGTVYIFLASIGGSLSLLRSVFATVLSLRRNRTGIIALSRPVRQSDLCAKIPGSPWP